MGAASQDLLERVAEAAWSLLERTRASAEAALAALPPEPGLTGTPLDGRLLQVLELAAIAPGDLGVDILKSALVALIDGAPGLPLQLHGFDPGAGQPRGLALACTVPGDTARVVAALTGAGPRGLAVEILATGAAPFGPVRLPLLNGWDLTLTADPRGGGRLQFARGEPPRVLDAAAPLRAAWDLERTGAPVALGPGPKLLLERVLAALEVDVDAAATPTYRLRLDLPGARLDLADGLLDALGGAAEDLRLDFGFAATPELGLGFPGGGVRAVIPADLALPGIQVEAVEAGLEAAGADLRLSLGLSFTAELPVAPIRFAVQGLGADFPVALGVDGLGIRPQGVAGRPPQGLGVEVTLPVISGGGFLGSTGPGAYAGRLELSLLQVSVQAFGLLQLPDAGRPLAFATLISFQFPPPGVQLGFGFSLNGIGGLVAINRRLETAALQQAVLDGSAEQLLFPADADRHAPATLATLARLFPPAEGRVVVGPMLQLAWGGRILTLSMAVIVELPDPIRLSLLGRLTLALPDPAAPLVRIQATVAGVFELSPTPRALVVASLSGSWIVGLPLHGELMLLARGGEDATFVLSVGGFHPRYNRPTGVPQLRRVSIDLTPPGFPGIRSETYVAVTSNAVQFGARLELSAQVAGCGLHGWLAFDVLFQWDPVFHFEARCAAGVAVEVFGATLMGVAFDLVVEGPAPWHVHGRGSVSLFLFSASLDFDVTWGDRPPPLPPPADLRAVLAQALAAPAAWVGAPAADLRSGVVLSPAARALVGGGRIVEPLGGVAARQRALPLGVEISRFQNAPAPAQTWRIARAELRPGVEADLQAATEDEFAPGAFLALTEDEKLTRPAFERFRSGVHLTPRQGLAGELRPVDGGFEVVLIPEISLGPAPDAMLGAAHAEVLLGLLDPHADLGLWADPQAEPVTVLDTQPVAAAATDTLVAQPLMLEGLSRTEALQAAEAAFGPVGPAFRVQLVERWELAA